VISSDSALTVVGPTKYAPIKITTILSMPLEGATPLRLAAPRINAGKIGLIAIPAVLKGAPVQYWSAPRTQGMLTAVIESWRRNRAN